MSDVLLELFCTIQVIIIGLITNDDIWIFHHILDEAKAWKVWIGKRLVRIWSVGKVHNHCYLPQLSLSNDLYVMASRRWSGVISGAASRSAMVRATRNMRS